MSQLPMYPTKFIQIIPLPSGWKAGYTQDTLPDGHITVEWSPLIAMALQANGDVIYLTTDFTGDINDATSPSNFWKIVGPDLGDVTIEHS